MESPSNVRKHLSLLELELVLCGPYGDARALALVQQLLYIQVA